MCVLLGVTSCTVMVAPPKSFEFSTLVAVTVTLPAVADAVNRPAEVMEPALEDHLTAALQPDAPATVALHCEVAPGATDVGVQATVIDVPEGDPGCDAMLFEPPQLARRETRGQIERSQSTVLLNQSLFILDLNLLIQKARNRFGLLNLETSASDRLRAGCRQKRPKLIFPIRVGRVARRLHGTWNVSR